MTLEGSRGSPLLPLAGRSLRHTRTAFSLILASLRGGPLKPFERTLTRG